MMNCNAAGPLHPLDPLCVVSPTHRQHPFYFDHMHHSHKKMGRVMRPRIATSPSSPLLFFPPDVLSANPEHQRPAQLPQRLCHDCMTSQVSPTFIFSPYLWLNGPLRMTWLNLLRTRTILSSLPSYFPDISTHLPPSPKSYVTLRHSAALGNGFSPPRLYTHQILPTPIFWLGLPAYLSFSSSDVSHIFLSPSWVPILHTVLDAASPRFHDLSFRSCNTDTIYHKANA